MRALALAMAVLAACASPDDEAEPVQTDPEKRLSADHACRAQAEAWCEAFRGCYGLDCEIEFCEPAFTASCMANRAQPIEVSKLLACLEAIDEQSCDVVTPDREDFGLPEACAWTEVAP